MIDCQLNKEKKAQDLSFALIRALQSLHFLGLLIKQGKGSTRLEFALIRAL